MENDARGTTDANMEDTLSYQDIGHLLVAKGEKLEAGDDDPEDVIREVVETLGRSESIRVREKTVDMNGRVSVGRDLSGDHGVTLFHPDSNGDEDSEGEGDEPGDAQ